MARNGCKKIVIVNGHGGNEHLLPLFAQAQLSNFHDYVVYVYLAREDAPGTPAVKDKIDYHAGESETSHVMVSRPDLVHMDRLPQESGKDQARQKLPASLYTGIWWYARFPNHYSGDAAPANKELGAFDMKSWTDGIVEAIRAAKADTESPRLQKEFYDRAQQPLRPQ